MNLNIFNILILVGVVQGVVLSFVFLLHNRFNREKANVYMAIVVLSFSLTNLQSWLLDTGISTENPSIILWYLPWEMLCPPAFYMFTIHYLKHQERNRLSRLLYVPFVFYLSVYLSYKIEALFIDKGMDLLSLGEKNVFKLEELIIIVFTLINGYFVYKILKKHKKKAIQQKSLMQQIDVSWYTNIFKISIGLCIFWALTTTFQMITNSPYGLYAYYPVWIGFTCFAYWIGYSGIYKQAIQHRNREILESKSSKSIPKNVKIVEKPELCKSTEPLENRYYQKFLSLLKEEKIYLNPLLSLEQVAARLGISANYLSQLINKTSDKHFSDLVGEYRVSEIKKMLDNSDFDNHTILAIGYDAGFNSKSAIYKTFKKFTGTTPSEYREQTLNTVTK